MSFRVEEYEARAKEAEKRLAELETQITHLKDKVENKTSEADDTKNKNEKFVLYYWGVKNRGNAIRLLFEEANVPYEDIKDKAAFDDIATCFGKANKTDVFAVPILQYQNSYLSQTSAIVQFVSTKLHLRPKCDFANARADMLVGNGFDLTTEFHNHRTDDKEKLSAFLNGRFQIWLDTIERPLLQLNKNQPLFYFEGRITHADLAIFNTLDALREGLSEKYFKAFVSDKHPTLHQHFQQIGSRPNIHKFISEQNKQGVRWFPEDHKMDNISKVLESA